MIVIYFKNTIPSQEGMSEWVSDYCKCNSGRTWKWIMHPVHAGIWGLILPDTETLIAFKLRFAVQTFDEFDTGEYEEDFAARQFDLSMG